jgi:hypothetical protein
MDLLDKAKRLIKSAPDPRRPLRDGMPQTKRLGFAIRPPHLNLFSPPSPRPDVP